MSKASLDPRARDRRWLSNVEGVGAIGSCGIHPEVVGSVLRTRGARYCEANTPLDWRSGLLLLRTMPPHNRHGQWVDRDDCFNRRDDYRMWNLRSVLDEIAGEWYERAVYGVWIRRIGRRTGVVYPRTIDSRISHHLRPRHWEVEWIPDLIPSRCQLNLHGVWHRTCGS